MPLTKGGKKAVIKEAIIFPGSLFPNAQKTFTKSKINSDASYCNQYREKCWNYLKYDSLNYQLWPLVKALGEDFVRTFWANSHSTHTGLDFDIRYVNGNWETGQHYTIRIRPLSKIERDRLSLSRADGHPQEAYRLSIGPFAFKGVDNYRQQKAKIYELYRRFTDPSINIVSAVRKLNA